MPQALCVCRLGCCERLFLTVPAGELGECAQEMNLVVSIWWFGLMSRTFISPSCRQTAAVDINQHSAITLWVVASRVSGLQPHAAAISYKLASSRVSSIIPEVRKAWYKAHNVHFGSVLYWCYLKKEMHRKSYGRVLNVAVCITAICNYSTWNMCINKVLVQVCI